MEEPPRAHLGLLIDVSGSMKTVFDSYKEYDEESKEESKVEQSRYDFIINFLKDFLTNQTKEKYRIFAGAFGLASQSTCDLIMLIKELQGMQETY